MCIHCGNVCKRMAKANECDSELIAIEREGKNKKDKGTLTTNSVSKVNITTGKITWEEKRDINLVVFCFVSFLFPPCYINI